MRVRKKLKWLIVEGIIGGDGRGNGGLVCSCAVFLFLNFLVISNIERFLLIFFSL